MFGSKLMAKQETTGLVKHTYQRKKKKTGRFKANLPESAFRPQTRGAGNECDMWAWGTEFPIQSFGWGFCRLKTLFMDGLLVLGSNS